MLLHVFTTTASSTVPGVADTPMMLRVCALENAWAISVALNTLGLNTDGENTLGLNTDGENTLGLNTDGENTLGLNTDGENTLGLNTDGENTDGENTLGLNTDGAYASGLKTDGENTDGENTDGENTDGAYSALSLVSAAEPLRHDLGEKCRTDVLEHGEVVVGRQTGQAHPDLLARLDVDLVPACLARGVDILANLRRAGDVQRLWPVIVVRRAGEARGRRRHLRRRYLYRDELPFGDTRDGRRDEIAGRIRRHVNGNGRR